MSLIMLKKAITSDDIVDAADEVDEKKGISVDNTFCLLVGHMVVLKKVVSSDDIFDAADEVDSLLMFRRPPLPTTNILRFLISHMVIFRDIQLGQAQYDGGDGHIKTGSASVPPFDDAPVCCYGGIPVVIMFV
jgi:hypothetical protein